MPVQRTPLSAVGHTHPVYSLSIVGSANAHNLVSISTDGRLCVWSLENLSNPTGTFYYFIILLFFFLPPPFERTQPRVDMKIELS
jgi:hypothetical protein